GGPGATFWMILTGLVGMATKFTECSLGCIYRKVDEKGVVHGGPMHYIMAGLGSRFKPMAIFYAFAGIMASYGAANMFQTNQAAELLKMNFGVPRLATGLVLSFLTGIVIIGGIKRIGSVAAKIVPTMANIYVLGALVVIIMNIEKIPEMFGLIFNSAFSGTAVVGGAAGIAVRTVMIQGIRRACFSNEAGMGSAAIAHSAARTDQPVREGIVALLEPFIDTVVICTMTSLVLVITGVWTLSPEEAKGATLTAMAFDRVIPGFGKFFVPVAVGLFAYSTLISWSYYGERCTDFIFGPKGIIPYKIIFCIAAVIGSVWELGAVVAFSDIMLALMVIPNLIAVAFLAKKVKGAVNEYFAKLKAGEFDIPENS
ncbi:MAG: alanine/glycine:cation symporter family protein, partial [Acidobacteria bacterium]|nr:alanine/glycine:cation symporter family protein [Acidobacteriota bacterium]